jgi:hypothetical protein
MTQSDRALYTELNRRLAKQDSSLYMSIQEFYSDVASEAYRTDEAFRQLCDARLEQSKHLWENTNHRTSDVRGGDCVHVTASIDNDGNVTAQETHAGYTGQSTPDPLSDDFNEGDATEIVHTESSVIVKVRG